MRKTWCCLLLTGLGMVAQARLANADPITLQYLVTVNQREDLVTTTSKAFTMVFPFSVTFDSQPIGAGGYSDQSRGAASAYAMFGLPTFSALPAALSGVGPTPGVGDRVNSQTFEERSVNSGGGDSLNVGASVYTRRYPADGTIYQSVLSLLVTPSVNFGGIANIGAPSLESFLAAMSQPLMFYYSTAGTTDTSSFFSEQLAASYIYFGTATPISSVPEPSTLALFAAGGAMLAARRRRHAGINRARALCTSV